MVRQEPPLNGPRRSSQPMQAEDAMYQQPGEAPEAGFDIQDALNQIEESVLDSPRLPVMGRTMINEDDLLDLLDAVRLNLPGAFQQAQQMLQQRDEILSEAEQYAQEIVATAEKQAAAILNDTTILRQAEHQAQQLRSQVEQECAALRSQAMMEIEQLQTQTRQECEELRKKSIGECQSIQTDADTYADQVLQRMETQFSDMLGVISNGRQQLFERQQRSNLPTPPGAPGAAGSAPISRRPVGGAPAPAQRPPGQPPLPPSSQPYIPPSPRSQRPRR